jgi:hypothetical protein
MDVQHVTYPAAPIAEPLDGTLLSLVDLPEATEGQSWLEGDGLFQTFNCLAGGVVAAETCGPMSASKYEQAEQAAWVDGLKFAAYGVVLCKMEDPKVLEAGVEAAFTASQSRMIEAALMEHVFTANVVDDPEDVGYLPGTWAAATDITPAAFDGIGVEPRVGLGLLESHMAANYVGKGIIHMPRAAFTVLDAFGALEWDGNKLRTGLRTPVAAGGGYDLPNTGPDGSEAPAGTKWLYATGGVVLRKVSIKTVSMMNIYAQQADDQAPNYVEGIDPNDLLAMSEGVYLVAVDCYKAAVLVKLYEEA